jgi:hypothetical protein
MSNVKVPKYISKKVSLVNQRIAEANKYVQEINKWAKEHGADTESFTWENDVLDGCPIAEGMYEEGIQKYFEEL